MSDPSDDPIEAWLFAGAGEMMALCADPDGGPVPKEHSPWTRLRGVTLEHDDEEEARRLIREHGFCCFEAHAAEDG